jgi:flavin reductase (DIM6/NTAB) family NADH-FMN oxidoreductase RutF
MIVNTYNFKKCLSNFASGVTIVTTITGEGKSFGVTISSFTSLSLEPPLILFCLGKKSSVYKHFIETSHFAVSILTDTQQDISKRFALRDHQAIWDGIEYFHGEQTNCPVIKNSAAYLECENYGHFDGGDHTIFIGKVLNASYNENSSPLIYCHSSYHTVK